jgi:hypothetical protein
MSPSPSKLIPLLLLRAIASFAARTAKTEPFFLVAWPVPHAVNRLHLSSLSHISHFFSRAHQVLFDSTASVLLISNPSFLHSFHSPAPSLSLLAVLQTGQEGQAFASFSRSDFMHASPVGRLQLHLPELNVYSQHTLLVTVPRLAPCSRACQCAALVGGVARVT